MLLSFLVLMMMAELMPGVVPEVLGAVPVSQPGDVVMSVVEVRYVSAPSWLRFDSVRGLGELGTATKLVRGVVCVRNVARSVGKLVSLLCR